MQIKIIDHTFSVHVVQKITQWKQGSVVIISKPTETTNTKLVDTKQPTKPATKPQETQSRKRKFEKRQDRELAKQLKLGTEAERNERQQNELQDFKNGQSKC